MLVLLVRRTKTEKGKNKSELQGLEEFRKGVKTLMQTSKGVQISLG